jgi:hypothetical protein
MQQDRLVMDPKSAVSSVAAQAVRSAVRPDGVCGVAARPRAGWCAAGAGGAERRGLEGAP